VPAEEAKEGWGWGGARAGVRARTVLLLWAALGLVLVAVFEREAPLFANVGTGDESWARGFRGWERDGLTGDGETTFRWTLDGARLELPVRVWAGDVDLRLRVARFTPAGAPAADIKLLANSVLVDRWHQGPRGWGVREVSLGRVKGPLRLQFRTQSPQGDGLGVALDWVEVRGARFLTPAPGLLAGILAILVGVPIGLALLIGVPRAAVLALALAAVAVIAVALDRLGGLMAVGAAGAPAVLGVAGLGLIRLLRRRPFTEATARALLPAALVSLLALIALSHPGYYYPDVDTHAGYLRALRASPALLIDPSPYQLRVGAWTRQIAGRRVAFPYSPVFHLLAWPVALVVGETAAVKSVAAFSVGAAIFLVRAWTEASELPGGLPAQILFAVLPVTSSRLALALYPALLGQALEGVVLLNLIRRYPDLLKLREVGVLFVLMTLAQASYTGSLFNVGSFVLAFVVLLGWGGEVPRAARLLVAYLLSAGVVVGVLYGRFVPVLVRDVLPHMGEPTVKSAEGPAFWLGAAGARFFDFYGGLLPPLLAIGVWSARAAPVPARRLLVAALAAGGGLLALRFLLPTLFRDAKEVELLMLPIAVLGGAGLGWLWNQPGVLGRATSWAWLAGITSWGACRAAHVYAERFIAVGR